MAGILSISSCCGIDVEIAALLIGYVNVSLEMLVMMYFIIFDPISLKFIWICK